MGFSPAQNRRAMVSSMMTTPGLRLSSRSVKSRPPTSGILTVSKYCVLTKLSDTRIGSFPVGGQIQRSKIRQGDRAHAGQGPEAAHHLLIKPLPLVIRPAERLQLKVHGQRILRVEAQIQIAGVLEAAEKQARADQQDEREGHLRAHK